MPETSRGVNIVSHRYFRAALRSVSGAGNPALAVEQAGAKKTAGMKRKRTGSGRGPGKGKAFVSTTIPAEIDAKIRALAAKGGVSRGALVRAYIIEGVQSGRYIGNVWQG
jgi:hypothetical protein